MNILNALVNYSHYFPEIPLSSSSLGAFKKLNISVNQRKYSALSIFLCILISISAFFVAYLIGFSAIALPVFFISFALSFFFLLKFPELELRRKTSIIEAELPMVIRTAGLLIDMKIPFQRALILASRQSKVIEREFRIINEEAAKGAPLNRALSRFAAESDSFAVKRAIAQLVFAYELGEGGKEIKRIGDELLLIQQHKLRDFSSKSAMFGLIFVAFTAVLPTFFLVYASIGSAVFKTNITTETAFFVMLFVFPLISFLILALSKASLPKTFFEEENQGNKLPIATLALAFLSVIAIIVLQKPFVYAVFPIFIGALAYIFHSEQKKEMVKENVEKYLPDAFFAISGLPKSTKIETIFEIIRDAGYGELSKQSEMSLKQLKANVKPEAVVEDLGKRTGSKMASRACSMLIHALNTNSFDRMGEVAEDLLKFSEITRERERLLSMQRYTMIFGGLLIPLIMNLSHSLFFSASKFLESSNTGVIESVFSLAVPIYIIIYAVLVSMYSADVESKRSRAGLYFLVISSLGLAIFYFV